MDFFPLNVLGGIFHIFFVLTVNGLALLINLADSLHLPGALGLAIIFLTVIIRFLLWPLMAKQMNLAQKTNELKPLVDLLQVKHKGDKQGFALARAQLYKEQGVSPAAGCLPAIIQIPIIYSLYQAIQSMLTPEGLNHVNELLLNGVAHLKHTPDPYFLGMDLGKKPGDFGILSIFLLVPLITALLQYIQSSMMTPSPVKVYPSDSPKEKKEKDSASDATMAIQSQMRYMLPLMVGYFAFTLPMALPLYWNVLCVVGILQQYRVSGWGALKPGKAPLSSHKAIPAPAKKGVVVKKKGSTKVTIERSPK
jgi:YidC/Oxa1 family membrane protein insertase